MQRDERRWRERKEVKSFGVTEKDGDGWSILGLKEVIKALGPESDAAREK